MPVSSRKTKRVGSQVGAAACHTTRAAATSGRSCSEGRTGFFDGHVQGRHRAPDRRQTGRRAERVLQLGQGAIRLLRDQRGQSVQVRLQHPAPPVPLDARCDFARLPPALLSAAAPTTRSRGTSPRRPRPSSRHHCRAGLVLGDPSNRLASVLLHWCNAEVPRRAQAVQGLSEKRFNTEIERGRKCGADTTGDRCLARHASTVSERVAKKRNLQWRLSMQSTRIVEPVFVGIVDVVLAGLVTMHRRRHRDSSEHRKHAPRQVQRPPTRPAGCARYEQGEKVLAP